MSDFQTIAAASVLSVLIVVVGLVVAARRDRARHIDEPTDLLPILGEDPVVKAFDEAARLLRGEVDPDFAVLADRRRLRAYEGDFQTGSIRRLTRRLARLDHS